MSESSSEAEFHWSSDGSDDEFDPLDTSGKLACSKCGVVGTPHPLNVDWEDNNEVTPLCKLHYDEQCNEMDGLVASNKCITKKIKEKTQID